jgi:hypothetical protein
LFTNLLPANPAIKPSTIQNRNGILSLYSVNAAAAWPTTSQRLSSAGVAVFGTKDLSSSVMASAATAETQRAANDNSVWLARTTTNNARCMHGQPFRLLFAKGRSSGNPT